MSPATKRPSKKPKSKSPRKMKSKSSRGPATPKKVKRAKKDPNAPKRAKSAYMFWLGANRARLTKPGMSVIDVTRVAGVEWGKVKERAKWEKMAAEDKRRYEAEIKRYKASGGALKSPKKAAAAKGKKKK